jgi:hypothetical protein
LFGGGIDSDHIDLRWVKRLGSDAKPKKMIAIASRPKIHTQKAAFDMN